MKVFVYGTLRKGFGNHSLLYNANFVGKATIKAAMYSMGYVPYVSLQTYEENDLVHGEVYEIDKDTLKRLDRLEGYREDNVDQCSYLLGRGLHLPHRVRRPSHR